MEKESVRQQSQRLANTLREFEERAKAGMNLVDNFKQSSDQLRVEKLGRTVESIYVDSESANQNRGSRSGFGKVNNTMDFGGGGQLRQGYQPANALDETLNISGGYNQQESFEQESISTKRLRPNQTPGISYEQMIQIRHMKEHQMELQQFSGSDEQKLKDELFELRSVMQEQNLQNIQEALGEVHTDIKKIHTRELSQLMKSKKEIYQCLAIEGQFYLPPFDECTIDFVRDLFSGQKKVSYHFAQ